MLDKRNFYINGKWVAPKKQNDFKVIDPSTEKECALHHNMLDDGRQAQH